MPVEAEIVLRLLLAVTLGAIIGLERELAAYEAVLREGKMVLLIPRYRKDKRFSLLAIRPLARKYDRIYLATAGRLGYEPLYWLGPEEKEQQVGSSDK